MRGEYWKVFSKACLLSFFLWIFTADIFAALVDDAHFFSSEQKSRVEKYLKFIGSSLGIDYQVIVSREAIRQDLVTYGVQLYKQYEVGRNTGGKGLLLFVDLSKKQIRVEVGYGLEGYLPDIKANQLATEFFLPHYKSGNLNAAVEATIEFLVDTLKKHLPSMAKDPKYMGSGGAGVSAIDEIQSEELTEETRRKLQSLLVPQVSVESSYRLEIAMLKKGFYYNDVPLFDESFRKYQAPQFPPMRNKGLARMMENPFRVLQEGDLAIIYYENFGAMGPVFLKRQKSGWVIDRTEVMKSIVYDYSNDGWYALDSGSRYFALMKKKFKAKKGSLNDGRIAWTFHMDQPRQSDQRTCEQAGGKWRAHNKVCILAASDVGRECFDVSECMGVCVAQLSSQELEKLKNEPGRPLFNRKGKCSATTGRFGCFPRVEKGTVHGILCAD